MVSLKEGEKKAQKLEDQLNSLDWQRMGWSSLRDADKDYKKSPVGYPQTKLSY